MYASIDLTNSIHNFPDSGEDNASPSLELRLGFSLHDRELHQPVTNLLIHILYIVESVLFV